MTNILQARQIFIMMQTRPAIAYEVTYIIILS